MDHILPSDDWDLDCLLQEAFISLPDTCTDDASSSRAKLQNLHHPATLHYPGATPPPGHSSPTPQLMLAPEVNLTSWHQLLPPQVSSDAASQAPPSLPLQDPSHTQDIFHQAHFALAPPHTPSPGLYGAQSLPQASQGLNQAPQRVPQEPQSPWALQDAPGMQQMPLGLGHEVPGDFPLPPSPVEVLRQSKAGVSGAGSAPASLARQGASRRGRRTSHTPREKLYQRTERFEDPVKEKKRQDAINSKKNRDRRAKELNDLRVKVDRFTKHRDNLLQEVHNLRQREANLLCQLDNAPTSPAHHRALSPAHPFPPSPAPTPEQATTPFTPSTPSPLHPASASPPPYHAHHIILTSPHMPPTPPSAHPAEKKPGQ
ncbi:RNA-binding protein 33-like [Portunus trituberculatus]|uniref:RNA-binding protein 33-like n=1 Tax=Portunus trituberculatus TaxID=210409 RepID=UPI001E1D0B2B|nr:RNA-binding protein 33-like [Portunus trituberculatus]